MEPKDQLGDSRREPRAQLEAYREKIMKEYPTLRDTFAASALGGLLASANSDIDLKQYVEVSYLIADAMLAEREKETK